MILLLKQEISSITFVNRCREENIYFEVFNQNDVSEFLTAFITVFMKKSIDQ